MASASARGRLGLLATWVTKDDDDDHATTTTNNSLDTNPSKLNKSCDQTHRLLVIATTNEILMVV